VHPAFGTSCLYRPHILTRITIENQNEPNAIHVFLFLEDLCYLTYREVTRAVIASYYHVTPYIAVLPSFPLSSLEVPHFPVNNNNVTIHTIEIVPKFADRMSPKQLHAQEAEQQ
jgi:hypothetical protein